ncbi:MAG TPA: hypothetical protein VGI47_12495 [Candidatus Binataceae bacterium]
MNAGPRLARPDLLEALEAHRDRTFRRTFKARVSDEASALDFINEVGFCSAFTHGLGLPCLREAIAGEREPALPEHIQHDYAIGLTWRLKDSLPARRAVYYGKVVGGRPGFVSLDLLPAFLCLRLRPGTYLDHYRRGDLSLCGKLIMDVLTKRGACETAVLKLSSGYHGPKKRPTFDRAMKELQERFLALKVEERNDPFSYVWDTLRARFSDARSRSRRLRPHAAAMQILTRYFEVAGFGNERSISRVLAIPFDLTGSSAAKLAQAGIVTRNCKIEGLSGPQTVLSRLFS